MLKNDYKSLVSLFVTGVIVLVYIVYNYYYSLNFPFQDDFLLIQFIETLRGGDVNFVKELFRTFNDHKPVIPRLIAFAEYKLTGSLNFRFYIGLVSLNIVFIFYFIYLQFKKGGLAFYYFLPVAFLYFQPLYYDISGWALNGMQHSFVMAYFVMAILFASRKSTSSHYAAILFCFLATFTHGNGILSFPALIFYFLCHKNFKQALASTLFMFVALGIYLGTYEGGQANVVTLDISRLIVYFLGFIGSGFAFWGDHILWSSVFGLIIIVFLLYMITRAAGVYFNKPVTLKPGSIELLTIFMFILACGAIISVFRSWAELEIASRFQLYASLSGIIFYILLINHFGFFRKALPFGIVVVFSAFYCFYSYYLFTDKIDRRRASYMSDVFNWTNNRNMFSVERTIVEYGGFYLLPAYEKKIFVLPEPIAQKSELDSMFNNQANTAIKSGIYKEDWNFNRSTKEREALRYFFLSSMLVPARQTILQDRFMVLRSRERGNVYLMAANPKVQSRKRIILTGNYYGSGFNVMIRNDDLDPGMYDIGILDLSCSGEKQFYRLDKQLQVQNQYLVLR